MARQSTFYQMHINQSYYRIYYLKNNEIKDEFTACGIDEARKYGRIDQLLEEEYKRYQRHPEDLRYNASMTWSMNVDAEDKVREDERKKEKVQIATELKKGGVAIEMIITSTGLTQEEIEKL